MWQRLANVWIHSFKAVQFHKPIKAQFAYMATTSSTALVRPVVVATKTSTRKSTWLENRLEKWTALSQVLATVYTNTR